MNYKRAIIIGVLLYLATFLIGAGLYFLGLDDPNDVVTNIVGLGILVIFVAISSVYYFKGKKTKKNAREGFFLGLIFLAIGFVLDILTVLPLIFRDGNPLQILASIYQSYYFIVGFIFVICMPIVIAEYLSKKR